MKKVITYSITTLSIFIFIISIGIMVIGTRAIQNNQPLFIFDYSFSIVPTDSMVGERADSIDQYDIAIIKKVSFESLNHDDVIVFQGEIDGSPALIIHRIVGDHPLGGFTTKGDNPAYGVDANPVTEENFQAIFVSKIIFLKFIAKIAANQKNFIFGLLSLVLMVMIVSELTHIIKTMKKNQEEQMKENQLKQLKEELYQEILEEEKKKLENKD